MSQGPLIVFMLPTRPVAYKQYSSETLVIHTWLCGSEPRFGPISAVWFREKEARHALPCPDCLHAWRPGKPGVSLSCLQIDSISGRSWATACDRLMDDVTLMRHCVISPILPSPTRHPEDVVMHVDRALKVAPFFPNHVCGGKKSLTGKWWAAVSSPDC